jgi:hypothetical protein
VIECLHTPTRLHRIFSILYLAKKRDREREREREENREKIIKEKISKVKSVKKENVIEKENNISSKENLIRQVTFKKSHLLYSPGDY